MVTKFAQLVWLLALILFTAGCGSQKSEVDLGPDAAAGAVPDLVGEYVVNGFDPLGTEYGGSLVIRAGDQTGEYHLQWIVTGSIQEGTGRLQGNQLLVDWHSIAGFREQSSGKAIYTVTVKRELYGVRTVDGYDKEGSEQAYPNN